MTIKEWTALKWAGIQQRQELKWKSHPHESQDRTFRKLIREGAKTHFGREHRFDSIRDYETFKQRVPVRDYEAFRPYVERIIAGEKDVLWPGRPKYLCMSSGTTSGMKYIPLTRDSIPNHIGAARNAMLNFVAQTGNASFLKGKMMFIQGSPELKKAGAIPSGRLSGIVAHHVPAYLHRNRLPSMKTNLISDWEQKIDEIIKETANADMTVLAGIPVWLQHYFERLLQATGAENVLKLFPNLQLLVTGGTKFEPYEMNFKRLLGSDIPRLEMYPASEGFFAYQDIPGENGLLLLLDEGIYYEFIRLDEYDRDDRRRICLREVETGVDYAMIINSNAGLWAYSIGDTVRFTSTNPYRILVTGRVQHFLSAFGEHVIAEEVEFAMSRAVESTNCLVHDFTVAPRFAHGDQKPRHEWFVEFVNEVGNLDKFTTILDTALRQKNAYYDNLVSGGFIQSPLVTKVRKRGFSDYMKQQGKLGGQNKLPRLTNDRRIAGALKEYSL